MLVPYISWEKYNEFQLTENKMDLNTQKWKIIHPPPNADHCNQSQKRLFDRNIQLQREQENNDLTAVHVMKRSIDLQLWIMVRNVKNVYAKNVIKN